MEFRYPLDCSIQSVGIHYDARWLASIKDIDSIAWLCSTLVWRLVVQRQSYYPSILTPRSRVPWRHSDPLPIKLLPQWSHDDWHDGAYPAKHRAAIRHCLWEEDAIWNSDPCKDRHRVLGRPSYLWATMGAPLFAVASTNGDPNVRYPRQLRRSWVRSATFKACHCEASAVLRFLEHPAT